MNERDVILRERAAFLHGLNLDEFSDRREALARRLYPLPTYERRRVVDDPPGHRFWQWRCSDGRIECRWNGLGGFTNEWISPEHSVERIDITPERCKLWADLLANPTETVEDV